MFRVPENLDFEAKRLLNKLLVLDPFKRPKASEIAGDRWLNNNGYNNLDFKFNKNAF
jgi:hypothetical protein